MSNAAVAVEGIRDTTYALKEPDDLLPIVKTCSTAEDVKDSIKNFEQTALEVSDR